MWTQYLFLYFLYKISFGACLENGLYGTTEEGKVLEGEQKLSDYIVKVLDHFKTSNPVGLPGVNIPDPYIVPDLKKSITFGTYIALKNTAVYGISKFKVLLANAEIAPMKCTAALTIDEVKAIGNYTLHTLLNTYSGNYTVHVQGIQTLAVVTLGVKRNGKIKAQNITMDIGFKNIEVQFENSGIVAFVIQGVFNSLGTLLFESIKPYILKDAYKQLRVKINRMLDQAAVEVLFPNSILPIDMIIFNARKKVMDLNMDPYKIRNYNTSVKFFDIYVTNTWILGVASFYREGNTTLRMENNTLIMEFNLRTQELQGSTEWEISTLQGFISKFGIAKFSIKYINIEVVIAQPLDTRKKPIFRFLNVDVGNVQSRFDGAGTLDYIFEFAMNMLPNLLRYQILDAFDDPIRHKIQERLNEIDVEELIKEQLPKIDKMEAEGVKISDILSSSQSEINDKDDFFNF